ncbi:MAG: hypothetical protein DRZ90_00350 [Spirochaetes bacterium]|nr:MAG: hypothetical protein DRP49_00375 [Spirochaetota bacterium]RKX80876.1 MAG: hypothetical protein DRP60_02090 [Spirochaetota bacterium]RKX99088.1 MAG: hypothetical protein DRZ90_00350 [Spirochaetota bacterium]
MKIKIIGILLAVIISSPLIYPQESVDEVSSQKSSEPEVDRREEIILYGIDDEVKTVLSDLQREKIDKYNELLLSVIQETRNTDIIQAIYRLWDDTSYKDGLAVAREELNKVLEDEDFDSTTVQSAIAFIADQKDIESLPLLYKLSDERDSRLAASSIRALGKIHQVEGSEELTEGNEAMLLERLKKEDPIAEDDLVAALIVTLGELRYQPAADELSGIAEDSGASAGHRRLACVSLGKIGRTVDYEIVERIFFESEDATLRSYALAGLAEFPDQDTAEILIQALKRDSFWRIRVTAAEKLAEKNGDGIDELLRYKASNDPVTQVRIASLKTLGLSGESDNFKYLLDFFKNNRNGTDVRLAALSVLTNNKIPGTNDAVNSVMDELWEKDEGRFLEFVCRDLSRIDWVELGPIYQRMLSHSNWLNQIYGIRGIRRNSIQTLQGSVNEMDRDGVDSRVRREVTTGK